MSENETTNRYLLLVSSCWVNTHISFILSTRAQVSVVNWNIVCHKSFGTGVVFDVWNISFEQNI